MSAWQAVVLLAALLAALLVGFALGARQGRLDADRLRAALRALARLWLAAPGKWARAVHAAVEVEAPDLHDAFHDAAEEIERARGTARPAPDPALDEGLQ